MFYAKEDHEGVHWVLYFKSFKVYYLHLLNSRVSKNEVKSQEPFIYFNHLDLLNNAIL